MSFLENIDINEIWNEFMRYNNIDKPAWFNRFSEHSLHLFLEKYTDNAITQSILCDELIKLWLEIDLITYRNVDFYEIKVPTGPHSPST